MKEVLIIFIILLVLLLMVSVLGGSIRLKSDEHYDDDIPLYDEYLLPPKMKPWESHPTFIPQHASNNFPETPSSPSMPSSGKELNYKHKPLSDGIEVPKGVISERAQVMEMSGVREGDVIIGSGSGIEESVGVEEDVDESEGLFERVTEESPESMYDPKYAFNEVDDHPTQVIEEQVSQLYMSDPHRYSEKSMKNVLPFNRVSDYAEFK